jgi:hypothetical protein
MTPCNSFLLSVPELSILNQGCIHRFFSNLQFYSVLIHKFGKNKINSLFYPVTTNYAPSLLLKK